MKIDLFCLACGPSLTKADCELVKQTGIDTLSVNTAWEIALFSKYIYAGDYKWWRVFKSKVPDTMQKWTCSKQAASKYGLNLHVASGPFNSGMRALIWALQNGYRNIALLGYDCSFKNGIHWHGLHDTKKGLSNPTPDKASKWQNQFLDVYERANRVGAKIVNCSRHTELGCFPLLSLEDVLKSDEPKEKEKKKADKKKTDKETIDREEFYRRI